MKFNSLKYSKKLKLAGFTEDQSEVFTEGFHEHISYQEIAQMKEIVINAFVFMLLLMLPRLSKVY
jgi:hypothetical protein